MKQSVIRELSTGELHERLEEDKKQLLKLKFNHAVSPLENPMKIEVYKKTVARLETEIRARILKEKENSNSNIS